MVGGEGVRKMSLEKYEVDAWKLFNMGRIESRLINAFISLYSLQ